MIRCLVAAVLSLFLALPACATDGPTQDQARILALRAANLIARQGLEKTHDLFERDGEFKHGEIYVGVIDFDGVWKVYPPRPTSEGKCVVTVTDADGHFLIQEIIAMAKDKGEGWVQYRWLNPATNRIQPKLTYVKRVPGVSLITYVGIYQ
ncbi:MAG TPA: cache domain-containing protein [Patescibacteria group bacterium]|nr:cache domain-containing protein [Patescibacteria group bacterium]